MKKSIDLRNQYHTITYKKYEIKESSEQIEVEYTYELTPYVFTPSITISKKYIHNNKIDKNFLEYLFFNFGLANIINYFKLTCPKRVVIEAGFIDEEQIHFFKKLIYNGLGEYFYRNGIHLSFEEFTTFEVKSNKTFLFKQDNNYHGNLILVGGGKDSIVSMEILKEEKEDNLCFLLERNIYPKNMPSYHSIYAANYTDDDIVTMDVEIDDLLLKLNKEGFLNGHIPFSSQLAFSSYIMAYLNNKKYIVVSNEASSNEGNVKDENVNHQYSKSIEFENDFREYTKKYFNKHIEYYSLLRPLLEVQIASIFAKYPKYHNIFRSCNLSSKNNNSNWCGHCSKCLFIFIILSPFIELEKLTTIFGTNMLEDKDLLETFKELLGEGVNKPFECVGTFEEVQYACNKTIEKLKKEQKQLPYLLDYYEKHYYFEIDTIEHYFNTQHNVPDKYINIIKKELEQND